MLRIKGKLNSLAGVSYIGLISCGSVLFLLFTALILTPSFTENQATATNNDSGISTYSTTTTPSVSISLPDSISFSEVVPTPDGATTTASTSFSVATTESDGYSLYLYSEGDNSLKSSNPANISSIIATQGDVGLTLSSLKSNTWGYNLGTTAPDDNTTYVGVPTDSTTPIQTKDTSTTGQADDTYTLSFGAKVDSSIPSGAYSNMLTMAVIAEPQSIVEKLPDGINPDIYTSTNPGVVDIYPTTGWGDDVIAIISDGQFTDVTSVTIGETDCEPYQVVNEYLIACKLPTKAASTDNGYAVAVTTSTGNIDMHNFTVRYFDPASTTSMQSFTEATCGSMNVGDIVPLVDERNGQTYRVRKMENNTCWMIDSMKYLGEETVISNIDGTSGIIYNNTSGYLNTVDGTSTQSSANFDKAFYNNPMGQAYCYSSDASSSYTKCGYLYNWYAATAGSGTYNLGTDGTNATASICPAGWELPTMEDFNNLTYLDIVDWQTTGKWSGMLSGYWNTSGAFAQLSTNGYYWSSNAYSSYNARDFYYKTNSVVLTDNTSKIAGFAVRCSIGESNGLVTINFDGNGATGGSMGQQVIAPGTTRQLKSNTFTRTNYIFNGWNTSPNGSGSSYADGANYTAASSYAGQTITLYAQWTPLPSLDDITYMQEMTPQICSATALDETTRLIDRRDGKYYWVAKLADGNCWMTQNLDYDLNTGKTLTPNDSDVSSNWTPPRSTLTSGFNDGNDNGEETYSYDPGMYVDNDPSSYTSCGTDFDLENCSIFTNVSSMTPMTDARTDGVVVSGNTYDAHYLIGNYYQWNAATAGTGAGLSSKNAPDSICPKGWMLSDDGLTGNRSFLELLESYGLDNSYDSTAMVSHPLYLLPGGQIYYARFPRVGSNGYYWTSYAVSGGGAAIAFDFNSSGISEWYDYSNMYAAHSIRCLARTE